jgi:hypothetical protein
LILTVVLTRRASSRFVISLLAEITSYEIF